MTLSDHLSRADTSRRLATVRLGPCNTAAYVADLYVSELPVIDLAALEEAFGRV